MINIDNYEGSTRGERYQNCIVSILSDIRDAVQPNTNVNDKPSLETILEPLKTIVVEDCTKEEIIEVPQKATQRKKRVKKEVSIKEVE